MSRESIAANIVTTLQGITGSYAPKLVTREPFDFEKLSNAQFPAILIQTDTESRADLTIGGATQTRDATIDYSVVCYIKGSSIDAARNGIVSAVENAIDADRTRGGNALDSQIVSIQTDQGSIAPVGGVIITVRVRYNFTRGAA